MSDDRPFEAPPKKKMEDEKPFGSSGAPAARPSSSMSNDHPFD